MKAFLILEDGTVFEGTSIGSTKDMISEIVFNTSMTGYLEVLTDPSYAGQAVVMTYPLIGNYGITPDMESKKAWPDGYIVRELSRMPSNFRCEGTIQDFLKEQDIPGIAGIDTRALTKILREKGTMNGMITTDEPGVYLEGKYGIRTENELVCHKAEKNEYGQFMEFENITYAPIDLDAIDPDEMTGREKKLLNDYHKMVYDTISPYMTDEERERLNVYTRAI